jgi:murein DD-endopeptidase MepM/ murein hydrolase activator NlpD
VRASPSASATPALPALASAAAAAGGNSPAGNAQIGNSLLGGAQGGAALTFEWPLAASGYVTRGAGGATDYNGPHPGVDIAVPTGTEVRAAAAGSVVEVGDDPEYGTFVRLAHVRGYQTIYGHASKILVAQGDRVAAGQPIALSGNTGRSTAPHLHFEITQGGKPLDPLPLIRKGH